MKTIGVKKLAAIVGGAALVGTALAPLAAATVTLQKSDVYNSSMQPLVNVVVGEKASNMDVWNAGRIALAIQSGAKVTKTVTGSTGGTTTGGTANTSAATVKVTVGGMVTYSGGVREFFSSYLNSADGTTKELNAQTVDNTYFKSFKNESRSYRVGSNSSTYTNTEKVTVTADAKFDATQQKIKDLVAYIGSGDLNYASTLSTTADINKGYQDSGSNDYVPIAFLGKNYVIDSISSDGGSVILVTDNAEKTYNLGDVIPVKGKNGQDYEVTIKTAGNNGTSNVANFELTDSNGTVVSTLSNQGASTTATLTFRDGQGKDLLATSLTLKSIVKSQQASSDVFQFVMLVGSDRIEVRNGQRFPYDPNNTNGNPDWMGVATFSGNSLTAIGIKNQQKKWTYDTTPLVSPYTFNQALGVASASLFEGSGIDTLGTVKFKGWYTAGGQVTTVTFAGTTSPQTDFGASGVGQTYGGVSYYDSQGTPHTIPMAIELPTTTMTSGGGGALSFQFGSYKYTYALDTGNNTFLVDQGAASDSNVLSSSLTIDNTLGTWADKNIGVGTGTDVNTTVPIILRGANDKDYKYLVKRKSSTGNEILLVLAGRQSNNSTNFTGKLDTLQWSAGGLWFIGTDVQDSDGVDTDLNHYAALGAIDINAGLIGTRPWYVPQIYDYNSVSPDSAVYGTGIFRLREGTAGDNNSDLGVPGSTATSGGIITVYVDTQNGYNGTVIAMNSTSGDYGGKRTVVDYNSTTQNLNNFSRDTSTTSNYTQAFTDWGAKVVLASDKSLTLTMPSARVPTYFTVESNDVTTDVSGGDELTIKVGETGTTPTGTKVTVASVDGVTVTGGTSTPDANAPGVTYVAAAEPNGKPTIQTDASAPSGSVVLVGGPFVNRLSAMIDGVSDIFQKDGDKAEVKTYTVSGTPHILVAGYSESDTTAAANEFINWLESQ